MISFHLILSDLQFRSYAPYKERNGDLTGKEKVNERQVISVVSSFLSA